MAKVPYQLSKPIQIGDNPEITQLSFRDEVVAGDMRGLKLQNLADPTTDDILTLAGRLSGYDSPTMSRISAQDLFKIAELVLGFLSAGLESGKTA